MEEFEGFMKVLDKANFHADIGKSQFMENMKSYLESITQKRYSINIYNDTIKDIINKITATNIPEFINQLDLPLYSDWQISGNKSENTNKNDVLEINRNFDGFVVNTASMFDSLGCLMREIYIHRWKETKRYFRGFSDYFKNYHKKEPLSTLLSSEIDDTDSTGWFYRLCGYRDTTTHVQVIKIMWTPLQNQAGVNQIGGYLPDHPYRLPLSYSDNLELTPFIEDIYKKVENLPEIFINCIKFDVLNNKNIPLFEK